MTMGRRPEFASAPARCRLRPPHNRWRYARYNCKMEERDQLDRLIDGADQLQSAMRMHANAGLPGFKMSDVDENPSGLVIRFFLERQTEALRAAATLARQSLGHLALAMGPARLRGAHLGCVSI